jgi:hypothetical protein
MESLVDECDVDGLLVRLTINRLIRAWGQLFETVGNFVERGCPLVNEEPIAADRPLFRSRAGHAAGDMKRWVLGPLESLIPGDFRFIAGDGCAPP